MFWCLVVTVVNVNSVRSRFCSAQYVCIKDKVVDCTSALLKIYKLKYEPFNRYKRSKTTYFVQFFDNLVVIIYNINIFFGKFTFMVFFIRLHMVLLMCNKFIE